VRAFWRWLTRPVISVADTMLMASAVLGADALKLSWGLPWPAVIAIVWAIVGAAAVLVGFVKGLMRRA
jgi:hypothetical protein